MNWFKSKRKHKPLNKKFNCTCRNWFCPFRETLGFDARTVRLKLDRPCREVFHICIPLNDDEDFHDVEEAVDKIAREFSKVMQNLGRDKRQVETYYQRLDGRLEAGSELVVYCDIYAEKSFN